MVRWAYHRAASLGPWELTADGTVGSLTAKVKESDAFTLAQPDLSFRVTRQNGSAWSWPIHSLHIAGDTLTAKVSMQENAQ